MALADHLHIDSKGEFLLKSGAFLASALPLYGLIPQGAKHVGYLAGVPDAGFWSNVASTAAVAGLSPFLISRARFLWASGTMGRKVEELEFDICGMKFSESDLFTNILITGTIGSGKTSTAIYSALDKLFMTYRHEKAPAGEDSLLKLGGISLDAKGEFYESILWFTHSAGRNVVEDVKVIRPNVMIPVARFVDEQGRSFFLSALETSFGSEIKHLFSINKDKDGNMYDGDGRLITTPINVFSLNAELREKHEPNLRSLRFDLKGHKLHFVGWRWEGDRLVRVLRTPRYGAVEYALDPAGKRITVEPPRELRFAELTGVNNGLRYNIVNPFLPAGEAAKRLVNIGKLLESEGSGGGDNPYFDKAAARQIAMCIQAWRMVYPAQCSGPDIMRVSTQPTAANKLVQDLKGRKEKLEQELATTKEATRNRDLKNTIKRIEDVINYFVDSWEKLEPKTKSIVQSVISNMFGEFLTDGNLQESFCSPATYSFEECISEGKFFCFLSGADYAALAKVMGTALKQDFQSIMLSRPGNAQLNKTRVILCIIDECQTYAVAGGSSGGGDENFMSLSRQSRVVNMMATQSDASLISVIGASKADVYLQSYGGRIWFHNSDPKTNERASNMCGKINKQMEEIQRNDFSAKKAFAVEKSDKLKREYRIQKAARFTPEAFNNLDKFEAIVFNKGRSGNYAKSSRQKNKPHPFGGALRGKVAEMMRWYIQAYCEQLAFHRDAENPGRKGRMWDHAETVYGPDTMIEEVTPAAASGVVAAGGVTGLVRGQTAAGVSAPAPAASSPTPAPAPAAPLPPGSLPIDDMDEEEPAPPPPPGPRAVPPVPAQPAPAAAAPRVPTPAPRPTPPAAGLDGPARADDVPKFVNRRRIEWKSDDERYTEADETDEDDFEDEDDTAGAPEEADETAAPPPEDVNEAVRQGRVSMEQLEKLRKLYVNRNTNVALVTRFVEQMAPDALYHPQKIVAAAAAQAESRAPAPDAVAKVAVGPRGRTGGNEQVVKSGAPPSILHRGGGDERLALFDLVKRQRIEATDAVQKAAAEAQANVPKVPAQADDEEDDDGAPSLEDLKEAGL